MTSDHVLGVGELFAGVGGFGLAARRCGARVLWASEIEPHARRVYAHHFPDVRQLGDVTAWEPDPATDTVDIITAGFPCQDLSVAGKRKGLKGERSGLFWEIVRVAERLRPRWLLLENVPGLFSSHDGRDFLTILAALDQLGYGVAWTVLDAQYFGLAQRRRRVFIVGHLGAPCPPEVLFEPEGVCGDTPPGGEARARVTQSLTRSLGAGGADAICFDETQITSPGNYSAPKPGVASHPLAAGARPPTIAHALRAEGADASEDGTGRGTPLVFTERTRRDGRNLETSDIGYALTNPGSGGRTHSRQVLANTVRRLTPRECERLQGFPDDWTLVDGMSDSARYRMLGNAVAVPVATWILRRLMAYTETVTFVEAP